MIQDVVWLRNTQSVCLVRE
ncbi:hypothetical protein L3Q82_015519 [Scortum barcoo]|uniref:Uncharacterized protein n=1 Tax=Scortum barcoo TaxID=214431 RepID=A0ACB8VQI2_9TELE|nr:hypothetical protein L3Q82_015519 [Scortum barcoo]